MKTDNLLGLSTNGFHRIVYSEWGKPAASLPPILCVHGVTRNKHDFDELASNFSQHGRHLYCPDMVGRGDSDWLENPANYNFNQYCADLTALIARTGAKQVDWIGTSMGGMLGMILAAQPQSPVRRLVLNDIGPFIPGSAIVRLATYVGRNPEFPSLAAAVRYYKVIYADFGNLTNEQWQHLAENGLRETSPGVFISKNDPAITVVSTKNKLAPLLHPIKALDGTLYNVDLWDVWHKVDCPVLVIHGKHSDILLPDTIKKMQTTHQNVTVLEVEDAGHAPTLLHSELQDSIYQWLAG